MASEWAKGRAVEIVGPPERFAEPGRSLVLSSLAAALDEARAEGAAEEAHHDGCNEALIEAHERADTAEAENAALRKRVEELERDVRVHDVGRWLSSCTPAERSEVAFYADVEGFKARAEKAERELSERDALLGWIDQALKAAHPDADVSDFGRSFEIVRCVVDRCLEAQASDMQNAELQHEIIKLQADLDAALVLCVESDWDVEVLGAGYEPAVYKAHAHVLPLLEKRREENRG